MSLSVRRLPARSIWRENRLAHLFRFERETPDLETLGEMETSVLFRADDRKASARVARAPLRNDTIRRGARLWESTDV